MPPHTFVYVIMGLILLFSLVHLAVCLGIIIPFHQYGDIFQQQISLCGYNIVIAILGLVNGGLGLLYTFKSTKLFGKIFISKDFSAQIKNYPCCSITILCLFFK
jgi:hypothetical protein